MTAILYSYDQCPYCARSIAALNYAQIDIEIRSVDINNLPSELKDINASVPYLILANEDTIDESWDIMKWALQQNDPDCWLGKDNQYLLGAEMQIETNDSFFAPALYQYRQSEHPENNREDCEEYLEELEELLTEHQYLVIDQITLTDIAVVPFINLFSSKEPIWFAQSPYPKCRRWLENLLNTSWLKAALAQH